MNNHPPWSRLYGSDNEYFKFRGWIYCPVVLQIGQERCVYESFFICVFWLPPTIDIYTTSVLHGSVDSLGAVYDTSVSLQPNQRSSPTMRKYCRIASLFRFKRLRSSSLPDAIERVQVFELDNMWLPPHYQNFTAATLAGEQRSARLRFPDNGVVLLGDFSSLTSLEEEEEPYNRNHKA